MNGYRINAGNLSRFLGEHNPGDKVEVLITRNGKVKSLEIILATNQTPIYKLVKIAQPNKQQEALYNQWLFTKK